MHPWCADFSRYLWMKAGWMKVGAEVTGLDPWAGSFYRASAVVWHSKASGYKPVAGDAVLDDWDGAPDLGTDGWGVIVRPDPGVRRPPVDPRPMPVVQSVAGDRALLPVRGS